MDDVAARTREGGVVAGIDFHNHVMPGVDDGAQTVDEAVAALHAFAVAGTTTIVVTPHVEGSLKGEQLESRLAALDSGYAVLQRHAMACGVVVHRGSEVLLNVPEPDLTDPRLRLAGGKFVLVEFPFALLPPHSERAIRAIASHGYTPIVAHPERYATVAQNLEIVMDWKQSGALVQVNGASLLGSYGREALRVAFELLQRGWADYLASDYHARGPLLIGEYRTVLARSDAAEEARVLIDTNPARMLEGQMPLPVAPIRRKRRGFWRSVTTILRA